MRATVTAKHAVDGVAPGAEGVFADTHATRAMIAAGLLLPLEELPPEPPAKPAKGPRVGTSGDVEKLREQFDSAWRERADGHRADMARAARRVEELEGIASKLEAENAALRAELEASKAKAPKAPKTPPAEG